MTTFPHVSPSRREMIVLRRSPYSVVSDGYIFGLFVRSITTSRFDRIYPGSKFSLEVAVGQIVFLSAVFLGFHSRYQITLISVPPSLGPM